MDSGSGESGKSTILKQMKIINQNGYTKEELQSWKIIVYRNLIESAQTLVKAMHNLGLAYEQPLNIVNYIERINNNLINICCFFLAIGSRTIDFKLLLSR
jgi:hypothetical protein